MLFFKIALHLLQTLQTLYFAVALLNDIIGTNERSPKKAPFIRKIKDALFSLAFPVALYVSGAFWTIYAIDKDLIFPEVVAKVTPVWANHVMHTFVGVFIIVELLFAARNYPSRKVTVSLTFTFILGYLIYLHLSYLKCGVWIYPLLDVLPWHLRTVFFVLSTLVAMFISIVGEKLDSIVNPKKDNAKHKKR